MSRLFEGAVELTVNKEVCHVQCEARTSLADLLREALNLTGTHLGCEHGACGACTVLLNGEPVRACLTLAAATHGQGVQTIEGLDDDEIASALRDAFKAEHALQCGFCTPGMLITARDIVVRFSGKKMHDDDLRRELAGNLCRCTGYLGIIRAVRRVLDATAQSS